MQQMATDNPISRWNSLHWRRQEVLETIVDHYAPENDKFGTSNVNSHFSDDNQTTTPTLNNLASEDGYLRRVATGGGPLLVANIKDPSEDDKTASPPYKQKSLADEMVNRERLSLDAAKYNWADDGSRNAFAAEFNKMASQVYLNPTWTRNLYVLTEEGKKAIQNGSS